MVSAAQAESMEAKMAARKRPHRIVSWNVNGLRAAERKGFSTWLSKSKASIVGLQEVRADEASLPDALKTPPGYRHHHVVAAEKKGYSGVAMYSKIKPVEVEISLGEERFDAEGRLQLLRFDKLLIANVYFPNGSGPNRDHSRIPYKLDFYRALFDKLEPARAAGDAILVMGDFNTAHEEIDIARPKSNKKTSGFTPREREDFTRILEMGWTDTFRHFHPDAKDQYSWWSVRARCRERNVGWRIDYVLASPGAMPFVKDAFILQDVMGSDHCPVGVDVDVALFSP